MAEQVPPAPLTNGEGEARSRLEHERAELELKTERLRLKTQWLLAGTAILGIVVVVLGAGWSRTADTSEQAASSAEAPNIRVSDLTRQVDQLTADKDSLTKENEELRAALERATETPLAPSPSPSTPTSSAPTTPAETDHATYHDGPLTLLPGSAAVDLDTPDSDDQWGRREAYQSLTGDINNDAETVDGSPFWGRRKDDGASQLESCSAATYAPLTFRYDSVKAEDQFCWLTDEGRFGVFR